MKICISKEIKSKEYRVGITPSDAGLLVRNRNIITIFLEFGGTYDRTT